MPSQRGRSDSHLLVVRRLFISSSAPSLKSSAALSLRLTLAFAVTASLLTACGSSSSEQSANAIAPKTESHAETVTVSRAEVEQMTSQVDFECRMPGGNCPPALAMSVARIDFTATTKLFKCTAFLVAPDIVATNAHCLPSDLRQASLSCRGRMSFYFGKSSEGPATSASCDQVISVTAIDENVKSPLYTRVPDLAFLKLSTPVNRSPFEVSRAGIPDHSALTVYTIDPATAGAGSHGIHGIARAKKCTTVQNSMLSPLYTSDIASVISASCALIPGNSGSPAVGADGKVVAIAQAIRSATDVDRKSFKNLILPGTFSDMAAFTTMSCADTPGSLSLAPTPDICRASLPSANAFVTALIAAAPAPDLEAAYAAWLPTAPKMFQFVNMYVSDRRASYPKLACVVSPEKWPRDGGKTATVSFQFPLWGLVPAIDENERVSIISGERDRPTVTLSFNFDDAKKNRVAHVTESIKSQTGVIHMAPTAFDLALCP